jgi:hypothetical protein
MEANVAKTRSPGYPAIGLGEAIAKAKLIYDKDYQNRLSKSVIAAHMGYKSLSGTSLPILAALNQYGLLEGRGDETRLSDMSVRIIAFELGSGERLQDLRNAANAPELFAELNKKFSGGKASDAAIRGYLLTQKFIPTAADTVIRSYRETLALLKEEEEVYKELNPEATFQADFDTVMDEMTFADLAQGNRPKSEPLKTNEEPSRAGTRREVITLDEGDVVITFPDNLSADSFGDLKAHLDLFVKKMQRRAAS